MTNEEFEEEYEDMDEEDIQDWIDNFNAGYELGMERAKKNKPLKVTRVKEEPVDWDAAMRILWKEGA